MSVPVLEDTMNGLNRTDLVANEMSLPYGVCGPYGTCVNGGPNDPTGYMCVCSSGFHGKRCQELVNHCDGDPCMHSGTCINTAEGFECICEEGFAGAQCQIALDLCQPNPCQNGGYCQHTEHPGDFQCRCAPGWSGRWCQLRTDDPCAVSKICLNNGLCHSDPLQAGQPNSRACANKTLCQNGATCVDVGNSFNCICPPGFDGRFCENDINECNSMPCFNNGTCRDLVNAFECDCPKGFIGTDCRIICLNASRPIAIQIRELLPDSFPGPSIPGCRPNAAHLNNQCARIRLQFSKERMPYSVTVGDICTAIRQLPSIQRERNRIKSDRAIGLSCDITAGYTDEAKSTIEITLSATDGQLRVDSNERELSFVHELAINISHEIAEKTSTNMTLEKPIDLNVGKHASDRTMPLPPITVLLGTPHLNKYWHRVLLGVMEIKVYTMAVKEKDLGSPILIPLACSLILATAFMCIIFICLYAQRKQRELLMRYAPTTAPNNDLSEDFMNPNSMKDHKFGPGGLYTDKRTRPDYRVPNATIPSQLSGTMYTSTEARNSAVNLRNSGRPVPALVV
ncbi:Delta protein [Fasciola gigantica]|uniref:Delta protein n=1 Tax=Fasciola gigantica TaxID=46835 RepID=A0A504YQT1_FASGI|nr:Delta protein [Fasciola gigantica]